MAVPESRRIRAAEAKRKERDVGAEFLEYAERETSESPTPPPESPFESPSEPAPNAAPRAARKATSKAAPKGAPQPAPQPAPTGTGDSFAGESMSVNYVPPGQHRSLRACMVCSVVQTSAVSCYTPLSLLHY